jgi:hypothetical protein
MPLDGDSHADHGGLDGGEVARQSAHIVGSDAGEGRHLVGRKFGGTRLQLVVADGVPVDIVVIDQPFGDDHVHHAQGQCCVGAGPDAHVPVGLLGGARRHRIDDHDLCPAALGFGDERPVMQVVADGVDRPQDDVPGMHEAFRVDGSRRAAGHEEGADRRRIAEGALRDRRAEPIEEGVTGVEPVQQAFGPEIAVGQDGRRSVLVDDGAPARLDLAQRLVPADALELAGALAAGPLQRMEHAIGAVDPVLIVVDLDAQPAARERMVGVAAHLDGFAIAHGRDHGTRIRTVVWTGAEDPLFGHGVSPCRKSRPY